MSSTSAAIIHILDQNDNVPYFLQDLYRGEISESAQIASLVHVYSNVTEITATTKMSEKLSMTGLPSSGSSSNKR